MSLLVHKVSKFSKNGLILDRVSCYIPKGSLVALLGPSGSGKSSLLRIIAGLDCPTYGSVWLNGIDTTNVPTQYRRMGFVFQNFALFKHMNVRDNICFGLKLRNLPAQEIVDRTVYFLKIFRISDIALRYPAHLSGGQKQRVALARSLAVQPKFLLLDEPFGALDEELRRYLSKWLKNHLKEKEITTIMVTHNQKEALSLSDEIMVLREGRLVQQDNPQSFYDRPIDKFVGEFLEPFIEAPNNVQLYSQSFSRKAVLFATHPVWARTLDNRPIDKYQFCLRPYELHLQSQIDLEASLAVVKNITYRKNVVELELLVPDFEWKFTIPMGYLAFQKLNIQFLLQKLYVKPKPKVIQRAYRFENNI